MIGSIPAPAALQALLEALENGGLGCTVILDRGDRLERIYASEGLARIFGVDLETLRAMPPADVLSAPQRERLVAMRASAGRGAPAPPAFETEVRRADGAVVPVEISLGHATLDGGRATFAFVRDLSAKAALTAAVRESEERFRQLAEASPDAITIWANDKYVYANPPALRFLGVSSLAELPDVVGGSKLGATQLEHVKEHVRRVRAGEVMPPRHVRLTMGGKEVLLESTILAITLDGQPAIVSYARDITERVLLQAELMKQDRLASVGLLAAGVAHELNNPLTSLGMEMGRLRALAESEGLSAEIRERLAHVDEAASRMKAIIADLLFMSRPIEQPQAHVDVAQILRSTTSLVRAGIVACPPIHEAIAPIPPIQAYASKLGQVFLNVLRNAVQAIEEVRDGAVHVRARAEGDAIVIDVADNGPGIPAELLPRITQPFFTTKRNGTGLGLWISQELVAQHGGRLSIASVVNEGTTVTLSFPHKVPAEAFRPAS